MIHLVRHGRTASNTKKRVMGWIDETLERELGSVPTPGEATSRAHHGAQPKSSIRCAPAVRSWIGTPTGQTPVHDALHPAQAAAFDSSFEAVRPESVGENGIFVPLLARAVVVLEGPER